MGKFDAWFWLSAGVLLILFFVLSGTSFPQTFYFITFLLPVAIGTSFYVREVLIPEYLIPRKYKQLTLYTIYLLVFSLYSQYLIIFLALYIFTYYQMGGANVLTLNISSLNLTIYLIVIIRAFIHVISLYREKEHVVSQPIAKESSDNPDVIVVRYNRTNYPIALSTILFIESLSDYVKIITTTGEEITTKKRISKFSDELPKRFLRTHRSFIVNHKHIQSYTKEYVTINDYQIPISRTYKGDVMQALMGNM